MVTIISLYESIKEMCKVSIASKYNALSSAILKKFVKNAYPSVKEKTIKPPFKHLNGQSMLLSQVTMPCPSQLLALSEFELLKSGMNDDHVANAILECPELLSKLSDFGLRDLAAKYDFFARTLIGNHDILHRMSGFGLREIGLKYEFFARALVEHPDLLSKLNEYGLRELGLKYEFIARAIFEHVDLLSKLDGYGLGLFGKKLKFITRTILERPELLSKLDEYAFSALGTEGEYFVTEILEKSELLLKLTSGCVVYLGLQYPLLAKEILKRSELLSKLEGFHLFDIGKKHEFFARGILEHPEILLKLHGYYLHGLGIRYEFIAREILKYPECLLKLDLHYLLELGKQYEFFARGIVERSELLQQLNEVAIYEVGNTYEFFARAIIENEDLISKISVRHLKVLIEKYVFFADAFPEIAAIPFDITEVEQEKVKQAIMTLKKHYIPYTNDDPLYTEILSCVAHALDLSLSFCTLLKENISYSTSPELFDAMINNHEKCSIFLDGLKELSDANISYLGNLQLFKAILIDENSTRAILDAVLALQNIGIQYSDNPSFFNEYTLIIHNKFVTQLLSNLKKSGFVYQNYKKLITSILNLVNTESIKMSVVLSIVNDLCAFAKNGLLESSEPEFEKQLQQLMDIVERKLEPTLTFGPLNKSAATLKIESLLEEICKTDIEKETLISFKEPENYILTLPNQQEINLSLLLKNANLTQLTLSTELIEKIGNWLQKLSGDSWKGLAIASNNVLAQLPIAEQRVIDLYTGLQYKNINKLFRSERLSTKIALHASEPQNYLAYFLVGCLLNDAANKLKLLPEELQDKSSSILDRGERLTEEVIKGRTQNVWIFPALTSFSLFKNGSPDFNGENTTKTKIQDADNAYVINSDEGEVIFAQGEQVITIQGPECLISSIKRSPSLDPKNHYLSHVALFHAFEKYLSIEYAEECSALEIGDKKVMRPNHGMPHTYRMIGMIELILQYFANYAADESFKEFCQYIEDEEIEWLRVASAFSITGRESEISATSNLEKYDSYRWKCHDHFLIFVQTKAAHISDAMEERMAHVIRYMGNPHYEAKENNHPDLKERQLRNYIHRILTIAHKIDLVRCYSTDEYSRAMQLCHDLSQKSEEQENALTELIRYIVELNKAHGNALHCDIGADGKLQNVCLSYQPIFGEVSLSMKRLFEVTQTVKRPLITQQFEYSSARDRMRVA